jgi:hypothetical protein
MTKKSIKILIPQALVLIVLDLDLRLATGNISESSGSTSTNKIPGSLSDKSRTFHAPNFDSSQKLKKKSFQDCRETHLDIDEVRSSSNSIFKTHVKDVLKKF